jgi:uncharacterized protein YyaL (SSP411 family)
MTTTTTVHANLPGQPEMPEELARRLAAAGAGHKYTNRLALEASPYLKQHAHNPVNWYPWSDEAFEDARRLRRPVFLSVGYSTCHWCHVMEHESFEDEEIAAYLNEHYVSIKVDREERPDVDAVYMSAVQQLTGSGGWPMSVFLTPDRQPFFGGTYFPPRDGARGARMGFLTLLHALRDKYDHEPTRVRDAAAAISDDIRRDMEGMSPAASAGVPDARVIAEAVDFYKRAFDPVWGGLRRAPKFPSNMPVRLLLRYHRRSGDAEALRLATFTLEKMAAGGMYDQVGGGFHRYSVDEKWLVPHFEKMLYDNALLAVAYTEAHQVTGRADFARVAREICDYVLREMTAPDGGFWSATDADSEGEEGKFFVWSKREIEALLGPEADRFIRHYGVTEGGNFEAHNILFVAAPDEKEHAALAGARAKLYETRKKRVHPHLDDKVLAAWNGLMISGLAFAGRVLAEPRYVQAATRAAEWLVRELRTPDGRMRRSRAQAHGFLEDQAFVAGGLLDLFEATFDRRWLEGALALADATEKHFADAEHGGWFMTAADGEKLLARERPQYDGAEPSGTSIAILNALRLATFTGDDRWRAVADKAFSSLHDVLANRPLAMTEALVALDFRSDAAREVGLVWPAGGDPEPLLAALRATFLPSRAIAGAAEADVAALGRTAVFLDGKVAQHGKPTGYVCERGRCELPATDPATFTEQLRKTKPYTFPTPGK